MFDTGTAFQIYLRSEAGYVKEVHVSEVGEADECVFAVVLLSCGAEENEGDLPHPTAFVGRQLELGLGTDFGEREDLDGEQRRGSRVYNWNINL